MSDEKKADKIREQSLTYEDYRSVRSSTMRPLLRERCDGEGNQGRWVTFSGEGSV